MTYQLNENCCCVLNYIFPFKGVVKLLNHRCPRGAYLLAVESTAKKVVPRHILYQVLSCCR